MKEMLAVVTWCFAHSQKNVSGSLGFLFSGLKKRERDHMVDLKYLRSCSYMLNFQEGDKKMMLGDGRFTLRFKQHWVMETGDQLSSAVWEIKAFWKSTAECERLMIMELMSVSDNVGSDSLRGLASTWSLHRKLLILQTHLHCQRFLKAHP